MTDPDIDRWAADWRDNAPPGADLARMARRERRLLTAWIALDWSVGAALVVFAAWLWIDDGTPMMRFTAVGIVALVLVSLVFTTRNWRGSLRGAGASAADYLELAVARGRARLRYVRFGWWILAADVVVIAGAFLIEARDEGMARMPAMLGMATVVILAAAAVLYAWGRHEHRKLERLITLQRATRVDSENVHD